jgi:serine protease Do
MKVKVWKTAAVAAALAGAAAVGGTFLPPAHAQDSPRPAKPHALEIFAGRGSQIGVSIRDIEESDTKAGKISQPGGVVIEEVSEDSPASRAGLKKGDIVVEFDGERVRSVRQFTRLVRETPVGRKTQASIVRDGQTTTVTLEPRESNSFNVFGDLDGVRALGDFGRDFQFAMPSPPPRPPRPPSGPVPPAPPAAPVLPDFESFVWRTGNGMGITVSDLSDQLAGYFGVKDGVLVSSVADDSAAAKAGIKAGDVMTSFNGADVTRSADLRRRIQRLQDGDEFTAGVVRDKKSLSLKGKIEATPSRRSYRSVI